MFQSLTGVEYLKTEIACKHDKSMEKATWDERIAHYDSLDFSESKVWKKASNPIGLRAAVNAMDSVHGGEETGYMISLDACSSGLQILSLLVSCPTSYALCGGNSKQCIDSYVTIYDSMNLHGALTRKEVKNAIMTSLYGSTAMPEATFGTNLELFYETMEEMAPGAWDLNLGLQELWASIPGSTYTWVLPDNFHACIETKNKELINFKFLEEKYSLSVTVDGRPDFHKGLGPNLIHSIDALVVREMYRRCMFSVSKLVMLTDIIMGKTLTGVESKKDTEMVDTLWNHYKRTGFLSVRILDHLDSSNMTLVDPMVIAKLITTLPNSPFEVVSVHDCFRCHPNYGDDLRRQYNNIMCQIKNSKMLTDMCRQVTGSKKMKARKVGVIDDATILEGNYLLA